MSFDIVQRHPSLATLDLIHLGESSNRWELFRAHFVVMPRDSM